VVFQLAKQNQINHPFNENKKLAGEDWVLSFWQSHLSISQPEAASATRARSFNAVTVAKFFKFVESIMETFQLNIHF